MNIKKLFPMVLVACFTVGLAPFFPEPHLWGKLKWVAGGGHGMQLMDYLDLLFHGAPWLVLIILSLLYITKSSRNGVGS